MTDTTSKPKDPRAEDPKPTTEGSGVCLTPQQEEEPKAGAKPDPR
jgi:hypothetical protein